MKTKGAVFPIVLLKMERVMTAGGVGNDKRAEDKSVLWEGFGVKLFGWNQLRIRATQWVIVLAKPKCYVCFFCVEK